MRLDDFDFDLPEDLIALRPAEPRDQARLLDVRPGARPELSDRIVADLPEYLRAGDVIVFNDTRVIPAQLDGRRLPRDGTPGEGARVHIQLHKRLAPDAWRCFARPARKLAVGDQIDFDGCSAIVNAAPGGGEVDLGFSLDGAALDGFVARSGTVPLPPYIASRRPPDRQDVGDYQTMFAREGGSVAAPTAGLHFTPELIDRIVAKGITPVFLTLHVGAGTFLPVKTDKVADHKMHAEWGVISRDAAATINAARGSGGRIVAVGTTSTRLLESATDEEGVVQPFVGETDIFITPGYRFRAVDVLMTNFHLPKSTLFMLVSAFCGLDVMRRAYAHAVSSAYRFYSYGDACLLHRRDRAV